MTTEVDIFKKALLALNINYDKIMKDKLDYECKKARYEELLEKKKRIDGDANPTETMTEEELGFIARFNDIDDPGTPIEVMYCSEFLESSENYCASVRPWYWLMGTRWYDEDDRLYDGEEFKSYRNLNYGYPAEDDMLYPYVVDGEYNVDYERMGDDIFFKNPVHRLDYISETSKRVKNKGKANEETVYVTIAPAIYFSFIAARLAVEIAPFIAPDTTVEQRATQQFQLTLQALLKINEHSQRKKNPDPKEFVL